jgi:hemoglobin
MIESAAFLRPYEWKARRLTKQSQAGEKMTHSNEQQTALLESPAMEDTAVRSAAELSLYEQLGGKRAIEAAVVVFYRKVLADGRINFFFDGVDMDRHIGKQKAMLTMAFGGPNHYLGVGLRHGHRHLVARGLNDSHFDAVVELLAATLAELGIAPALIAKVAAVAESTRNDVLNL